jgi:tRNA G10  N-methylase Trm11
MDGSSISQIYFGLIVAACRRNPTKDETFYLKYDLKYRPYLGPTSTDHELALLMVNQG